MGSTTGSNREYKSDVFSMLMEEPRHALSVYNALNGSDYRDPSEVEMKKLENSIRLSVRNDASFIIDDYLNLYEHQSSISPNMPLRFLIYITDLFRSIIKKQDLFSENLLKIPTPKFAVFYNGKKDYPETACLKISDAYEHPVGSRNWNWSARYITSILGKTRCCWIVAACWGSTRSLWSVCVLMRGNARWMKHWIW